MNKTHICLEGVRHVVEENSSNKHPDFVIPEGFQDLMLLMMHVLDTSHVGLETLNSNDFFTLAQKFCRVRGIWEDPPQRTSKTDCDKSKLENG